jgi:uncharacterized protein
MHTFVDGLLGGALIGLAAAVLLLFSGDVLGASGIVSSVALAPITSIQDPHQHWTMVLIASFFLTGRLFFASEYQDREGGLASISWAGYLIGGFFVGFGTKLGHGCTSGHGICGLPRFSKRSLAAVVTFMSMGMLTAYLTQHATTPFPTQAFAFLRADPQVPIAIWTQAGAVASFFLVVVALGAASFFSEPTVNDSRKLAPAAIAGVLFAAGLYVSQMVYPVCVMGFLNLGLIPSGEWDATLMFVMGGGVTISFVAYQFVPGHSLFPGGCCKSMTKPLALSDGSDFCVPTNTVIDFDLIFGSTCFGLGWGISGLCPGPAMLLACIGVSWVLACYWPAFIVGAYLASRLRGRHPACWQKTDNSQKDEANQDYFRQDKLETAERGKAQPEPTAIFDVSNGEFSHSLDA